MWMNSPRVGSSVKRCTPWPKVTTRSVALHTQTHTRGFQNLQHTSLGWLYARTTRTLEIYPSWLNV
jgi:hypothetical protein